MSTVRRPEILDELRARTRAAHERVERGVPITRDEGDARDLRRLLERLHGLHLPIEERLEGLAWARVGLDLQERRKAWRIARDLLALGHDAASIAALPRCARLPDVGDLPRGLGCLYVIEGSMLGGRVLARALRARLGPAVAGALSFLDAYGERLAALWSDLGRALDQAGRAPAARAAILAAANDTFACVERWLVAREGPA